jgi:hypothetical protein
MVLLLKAYGKIVSLSRANVFTLILVLMRELGMMVDLKELAKELGKINVDMKVSFLLENLVELEQNFILMDEKL